MKIISLTRYKNYNINDLFTATRDSSSASAMLTKMIKLSRVIHVCNLSMLYIKNVLKVKMPINNNEETNSTVCVTEY